MHSAYLRSLFTFITPIADDISITSTLLAYLTYFCSSSLMVNIYPLTCLTYFVFALCYLLSVCLLQDAWTVSRSWQGIQQSWAFCWCSSSPSSWLHWSHQFSWHISPIISQLALLWWWTFILWHISPILFMPITIFFYLSVCCRIMDCLILLARRSAKLSSMLTFITSIADISGHVNSPGVSHLFSQLIYDGEHVYLTYFVFDRYYLLSVCLLQNAWTVSHSWQGIQQSRALCWSSSPLADNVSSHVNSPGISSQLISDGKHLAILWHISPTCIWLCPFFYLSAYCKDAQVVLHLHSWQDVQQSRALLMFITPSWWRLKSHQLSWHTSLIFHSSSLIDGEHLFSDISHLFCLCYLLLSVCIL